jgi:hypothetical protein
MNYIGHHEVARRLSGEDEVEFRFGAVVPDLVGMFRLHRTYKTSSSVERRINSGIILHGKTNRLFDDMPEIIILEKSLTTGLKDVMPRWPAVQCARAGKDMLFDGLFRGDEEIMDSYRRTLDRAVSGTLLLSGISEPEHDLVNGLAILEKGTTPDYRNALVVAQRLHSRLMGTRTEFAVQYITPMAFVLADHQPTIYEMGEKVTNQVVSQLQVA